MHSYIYSFVYVLIDVGRDAFSYVFSVFVYVDMQLCNYRIMQAVMHSLFYVCI